MDSIVMGLLEGMFNALPTRDEDNMKAGVATWLRDRGYHVCDGDAELRELALSETDLAEPSEET